jgi:hypothetical protein
MNSSSQRISLEIEQRVFKAYVHDKISATTIARTERICIGTVTNIVRRLGGTVRTPSESHRRKRVNETFFESIDTEEKAYWLGFLYADGYVNERGDLSVGLADRDHMHLEKLRFALNSDTSVRRYVATTNFGTYAKARFGIRSHRLTHDLTQHGVGPAKSQRFTSILPARVERHFWRGFFDGDGSISDDETKPLRLSVVGNLECIHAFADFVARVVGIAVPVRTHKSIFEGRLCSFKAFLVADLLYRDASVYLDRKHDAYLRASKTAPTKRHWKKNEPAKTFSLPKGCTSLGTELPSPPLQLAQ